MKRLLICVNLTDESIDLYKDHFKGFDWDGIEEVHIVHSFQLQVYTDNFYLTSYPTENEYGPIENSVIEVLTNLEKSIITSADGPKIVKKCIFSNSPKESIVDYAVENNISEMIIGTKGRHGISGLFSSSFAEYMVRHAQCILKILRLKE